MHLCSNDTNSKCIEKATELMERCLNIFDTNKNRMMGLQEVRMCMHTCICTRYRHHTCVFYLTRNRIFVHKHIYKQVIHAHTQFPVAAYKAFLGSFVSTYTHTHLLVRTDE